MVYGSSDVPHGGLYAVGHRLDVPEPLAQVMRQFHRYNAMT